MEFLLVPLLALAAVTAAINKLAEFIFHIHLSCRLLALLVGFAWLVSLVLPELFFHSAGFLGSIGVSLAGALGFACLAAVYDTRTQASRMIAVAAQPELSPQPDRTEPLPIAEETAVAALMTETLPDAAEPATEHAANPDAILVDAVGEDAPESLPTFAEVLSSVTVEQAMDISGIDKEETVELAVEVTEDSALPADVTPPATQEDTVIVEQPASDSLEDLLEFAFAQRDQHRLDAALDAFRLITRLYADSAALPMIVAEIVSTLQNQGDYSGAAAELAQFLQSGNLRRHEKQLRFFEQKLDELQAEADKWDG